MAGLIDTITGLIYGDSLIWRQGLGGGTLINSLGPVPTDDGYITEDGLDFYVAEDGTTFYVQE